MENPVAAVHSTPVVNSDIASIRNPGNL